MPFIYCDRYYEILAAVFDSFKCSLIINVDSLNIDLWGHFAAYIIIIIYQQPSHSLALCCRSSLNEICIK